MQVSSTWVPPEARGVSVTQPVDSPPPTAVISCGVAVVWIEEGEELAEVLSSSPRDAATTTEPVAMTATAAAESSAVRMVRRRWCRSAAATRAGSRVSGTGSRAADGSNTSAGTRASRPGRPASSRTARAALVAACARCRS